MLDRLELLNGPAGNALRRRVGGDQVGMVCLELLELVKELVECFVGDLG